MHPYAQELFVYTEPASNMAAKSLGVRVAHNLMRGQGTQQYSNLLIPELMLGASKHIMIHADGFVSNAADRFQVNGGSLYLKYRFYSEDEVHSHFRMAAYVRSALNNLPVVQEGINLYGQNSGYEAGVVATRLINKTALSAGSSIVHATDNGHDNPFGYGTKARNAISYNLSFGRLVLPHEYTSYDQANVNLMAELLGQTNADSGKSFIDLAPAVQVILFSRVRIDLGYRFAVIHDLYRYSKDGFLVRLEYNFFNLFK